MMHKVILGLITLCFILSGCSSTENKDEGFISVAEAEKLVQVWIKTHKDQNYWDSNPKLKEITTEEIWDRLNAQVFKLISDTGSISEVDAYLIKNRNLYPMSIGFGGSGLTEMCVCDINNDSKSDLVYIYSWGSGMHRSLVKAYCFDGPQPTKISADFAVTNADLTIRKTGKHQIDLYIPFHPRSIRLGRLTFKNDGERRSLDVIMDTKLPEEWKRNILRKKVSAR